MADDDRSPNPDVPRDRQSQLLSPFSAPGAPQPSVWRTPKPQPESNQNSGDLVVYSSKLLFIMFDNRWYSSNELVDCQLQLTNTIDDPHSKKVYPNVNKWALQRLKLCQIEIGLFLRLMHHLKNGPLIQLDIDSLKISLISVFDMDNVFKYLRVLSIGSVEVEDDFGLPAHKDGTHFTFNAPNLTTVHLGKQSAF